MFQTLAASVLGLVVSGALLAGSVPRLSAEADAQSGPTTRTLFASVVAKDGTPVTDLTATEFEVKEAGKTHEITSAKLATMPLRVHVIVSDNGTGAFQLGMLRMAQALIERSEFAFTSVLVQPERVMPFTRNGELIGAGLQKLGRRGDGRGASQLMEAITDALKDIAAPGFHPVLVVLRMGGESTSTLNHATIREALRTSGTTLYVIARAGASKAPIGAAGVPSMSPEAAQQQGADADRNDALLNLNLVLGDGARESGGFQVETSLTSAVPALDALTAELKNQYQITYVLPAGTKPSDRVQVSTKRKNVTLRAPQKVAN